MFDRSRETDAGSRMEPPGELTDKQWSLIADLFPQPAPSPEGGRPRVPARACVEGIIWVLRSGARWKDLPRSFPSYVTCWRRLVEWTDAGIWEQAWTRLVRLLDQRGRIDWQESFADATFASAKKGEIASARLVGAKGPS
jgi:transposase